MQVLCLLAPKCHKKVFFLIYRNQASNTCMFRVACLCALSLRAHMRPIAPPTPRQAARHEPKCAKKRASFGPGISSSASATNRGERLEHPHATVLYVCSWCTEQFQDFVLADFRDFCRNESGRLSAFIHDLQANLPSDATQQPFSLLPLSSSSSPVV